MFKVRNEGNLIKFHPIPKRVVFAKTKVFGSAFNRFEDYTITLKETKSSISIWSNCRALKTLSEKQYKNDVSALEKSFKNYDCLICTNPYCTFFSTMIFVAPRRIVFLNDDGTLKKFRLTDDSHYFEFPSAENDANI